MRTSRIKEEGAGYYHIMSRVVDRRMALNTAEKERFRTIMRSMEAFSGCRVLTHAILDNHFHALLHVPDRQEVGDDEFIRRMAHLYDRQVVKHRREYLGELRRDGHDAVAEEFKARYTYRMYDLSEFVKTVKQRFTQSHNRRHGRRGTLWEERFKSILVGDSEWALTAVAAYIDLNAVRAGIVSDPKDYRFCGYGQAMGGSIPARNGIRCVLLSLGADASWKDTTREYRKLLYVTGEATGLSTTGQPARPGFAPETVVEVLEAGGQLPINKLLRCRVRYFTDGVVLGSRAFVEEAFCRHRHQFSSKRTTGARSMAGGGWGDLCAIRRLRLRPIQPPASSG